MAALSTPLTFRVAQSPPPLHQQGTRPLPHRGAQLRGEGVSARGLRVHSAPGPCRRPCGVSRALGGAPGFSRHAGQGGGGITAAWVPMRSRGHWAACAEGDILGGRACLAGALGPRAGQELTGEPWRLGTWRRPPSPCRRRPSAVCAPPRAPKPLSPVRTAVLRLPQGVALGASAQARPGLPTASPSVRFCVLTRANTAAVTQIHPSKTTLPTASMLAPAKGPLTLSSRGPSLTSQQVQTCVLETRPAPTPVTAPPKLSGRLRPHGGGRPSGSWGRPRPPDQQLQGQCQGVLPILPPPPADPQQTGLQAGRAHGCPSSLPAPLTWWPK